MQMIINWFVSAVAIMIASYLLPGVMVSGLIAALVVAIVLGFINVFIKPVLILLTLPINILSLGLFTLVINALLVMLASAIVPGFRVDGFWWAMLFALVLFAVNLMFSIFREKR